MSSATRAPATYASGLLSSPKKQELAAAGVNVSFRDERNAHSLTLNQPGEPHCRGLCDERCCHGDYPGDQGNQSTKLVHLIRASGRVLTRQGVTTCAWRTGNVRRVVAQTFELPSTAAKPPNGLTKGVTL